MKTTVKSLLTILGIATITSVSGQYRNDPTYSEQNYKHPNKAAKMKAIREAQPEVFVEEIKPDKVRAENSLTASSNYKGMSVERSAEKEFRISEAPAPSPFVPVPNSNYKQQFPSRTRKVEIPDDRTEPGIVAADME